MIELSHVHIRGYRSIYDLAVPLSGLNLIVGGNGCGKTNLYRALSLVAAAARGDLARTVATEGGMPSVLWAGTQARTAASSVAIRVESDIIAYDLAFGLPDGDAQTVFMRDPEVEHEHIWMPDDGPGETLAKRHRSRAWLRTDAGGRSTHPGELLCSESLLAQLKDRHRFPEIGILSDHISGWRFYHRFATGENEPIRKPQVGLRSPVLANDGSNLAAALQTIIETGDADALADAVSSAFRGSKLVIDCDEKVRLTVGMVMPGMSRPLEAQELSDGTLRFLCLVAALLSPRPPSLLALNEPETSLHPDLIGTLARLIVHAAKKAQVIVTTHSGALTEEVGRRTASTRIALALDEGRTVMTH